MKKSFKVWIWLGAVLAFVLSFPLHFLYDFLGGNPMWLGYFVPISESVWEHLKLLFYPAILTGIAEYFLVQKSYPNFIPAKTIGIFAGMLSIVASFYTYSGIIGRNFLVADILTYVLGIIVTAITTIKIMESGKFNSKISRVLSAMFLVIMAILFAVFTYNPPNLNIFWEV